MIFQTEKQLEENEDKLDENSKEDLTECIGRLKKALEEKDLELIDTITDEMDTKWQEISTQLYEQTQETTEDTPEPQNSDATDVEFEEVK